MMKDFRFKSKWVTEYKIYNLSVWTMRKKVNHAKNVDKADSEYTDPEWQ